MLSTKISAMLLESQESRGYEIGQAEGTKRHRKTYYRVREDPVASGWPPHTSTRHGRKLRYPRGPSRKVEATPASTSPTISELTAVRKLEHAPSEEQFDSRSARAVTRTLWSGSCITPRVL